MPDKYINDNANKVIVSDSYTFDYLIESNCLYVDKTEFLYKLVSSPKKLYFFSRPRRFGKSLTISTLKAIFQGEKELFKGLYIGNQPYDWKTYPVIHLDMGSVYSENAERLEDNLLSLIEDIAKKYKINLREKYPNEVFDQIMEKITLVGANFDFETGRLKEYKKKEL